MELRNISCRIYFRFGFEYSEFDLFWRYLSFYTYVVVNYIIEFNIKNLLLD